MSRSAKKGPYVDAKLLKKVGSRKPGSGAIKTWARSSTIAPEMIGYTFSIHNGKSFIDVLIKEEMVGHRFGEFSPTRKFVKHGGKLTKQLEQAAAQAEAVKKAAASGPAPAGK